MKQAGLAVLATLVGGLCWELADAADVASWTRGACQHAYVGGDYRTYLSFKSGKSSIIVDQEVIGQNNYIGACRHIFCWWIMY